MKLCFILLLGQQDLSENNHKLTWSLVYVQLLSIPILAKIINDFESIDSNRELC